MHPPCHAHQFLVSTARALEPGQEDENQAGGSLPLLMSSIRFGPAKRYSESNLGVPLYDEVPLSRNFSLYFPPFKLCHTGHQPENLQFEQEFTRYYFSNPFKTVDDAIPKGDNYFPDLFTSDPSPETSSHHKNRRHLFSSEPSARHTPVERGQCTTLFSASTRTPPFQQVIDSKGVLPKDLQKEDGGSDENDWVLVSPVISPLRHQTVFQNIQNPIDTTITLPSPVDSKPFSDSLASALPGSLHTT